MWPNREFLDLIGIDLPIIQAPMAGANGSAMAIVVSEAGGLGSLPCAMLDAAMVHAGIGVIRQQTAKPVNVNLLCHKPAAPDPDRDAAWKRYLVHRIGNLDSPDIVGFRLKLKAWFDSLWSDSLISGEDYARTIPCD